MTDQNQDNKLNQPILKRPNYFAGRYLFEDDFQLEQQYHIDRQRRHNRLLHVAGIVKGLEVIAGENSTVTVTAGSAIDSQGREIILLEETTFSLKDIFDDLGDEEESGKEFAEKSGTYDLWIEYNEEGSDSLQTGESKIFNYNQEKPKFKLTKRPASWKYIERLIANRIYLAQIRAPEGIVATDKDITWGRHYSGIYLPVPKGAGITLRANASSHPKSAIFDGSLQINGSLQIDESLIIGKEGTAIKLRSEASSHPKSAIFDGSLQINGSLQIDESLIIGKEGTAIKLRSEASNNTKLAIFDGSLQIDENLYFMDKAKIFVQEKLIIQSLKDGHLANLEVTGMLKAKGLDIEAIKPASAKYMWNEKIYEVKVGKEITNPTTSIQMQDVTTIPILVSISGYFLGPDEQVWIDFDESTHRWRLNAKAGTKVVNAKAICIKLSDNDRLLVYQDSVNKNAGDNIQTTQKNLDDKEFTSEKWTER